MGYVWRLLEGAFRNARDEPIEPFDIYMSFRAATQPSGYGATVELGARTHNIGKWGKVFLASVLISNTEIWACCQILNVKPPWREPHGWRLWRRWRTETRHLAPPPCVDAEARAIQYEACISAQYRMNTMQETLNVLSGKGSKYPHFIRVDEPIDWTDWEERWEDDLQNTKSDIDLADSPWLNPRLQKLEQDWTDLRRNHDGHVAPADPGSCDEGSPLDVELRLVAGKRLAVLRGKNIDLPEVPFSLFWLLAEKAVETSDPIPVQQIETHVWGDNLSRMKRQVSDVVRDLRAALDESTGTRSGRDIIINRPGVGYYLGLDGTKIRLEQKS